MSTEELRLSAVKRDGNAIEFIENPSEEVKLTAVEQRKGAILYINNLTQKVLLYIKMKDL